MENIKMLYQKAEVKDNKIVITESIQVGQDTLTSDCWLIQFSGLSACKTCEVKGTADCGGGEALAKLQK